MVIGMLHSSRHLIHMVELSGSARREVKKVEREEEACLMREMRVCSSLSVSRKAIVGWSSLWVLQMLLTMSARRLATRVSQSSLDKPASLVSKPWDRSSLMWKYAGNWARLVSSSNVCGDLGVGNGVGSGNGILEGGLYHPRREGY